MLKDDDIMSGNNKGDAFRQFQTRKHSLQNGCFIPISALFFAGLLSSSHTKKCLKLEKNISFLSATRFEGYTNVYPSKSMFFYLELPLCIALLFTCYRKYLKDLLFSQQPSFCMLSLRFFSEALRRRDHRRKERLQVRLSMRRGT